MKTFVIKPLGVITVCQIIVIVFHMINKVSASTLRITLDLIAGLILSYCIARIVYWKRK